MDVGGMMGGAFGLSRWEAVVDVRPRSSLFWMIEMNDGRLRRT